MKSFVKNPWIIFLTIILPIFGWAYQCGAENAAAAKDLESKQRESEFILKLHEIERQYNNELSDTKRETDKWKEKYLVAISNTSSAP